MRIAALNIQNGGGARRVPLIAAAVAGLSPDVVLLSEFYVNSSGARLLSLLDEAGLTNQAHGDPLTLEAPYTVAIASRHRLNDVRAPLAGTNSRQRVLQATIDDVEVVAVYLPLAKPLVTFWRETFLPFVATMVARPCVLAGDFNTGRNFVDESGSALFGSKEFESMTESSWTDAYRSLRPAGDDRSWYHRSGNGFRIDHAFLSPSLAPRLTSATYHHETRLAGLSDHSALVVDLA